MKLVRLFHTTVLILVLLAIGFGFPSAVSGKPADRVNSATWYVQAGGSGNCSSWAAACDLQTALGGAAFGDQVWVAAGIYRPTADSDRMKSFEMPGSIAVYGGFPAGGGDWQTRSWKVNATYLSGDIGAPGVNTDNSFHVVVAEDVSSGAILDGFTISGGQADGDEEDVGGGIYLDGASPTLRNLVISGNYAELGAGAFTSGSSSSLTDVTFSNNTSGYVGGGMCSFESSLMLISVTFSDNTAHDYGGGLDNYTSSSTLINVTFSGNTAPNGGGLFNTAGSNPTLTNVTFTGNSGVKGGGMYNYNSSPTITNAILWGNTTTQVVSEGSAAPVITFSDVQGGFTGMGNINLDPNLSLLGDNGGSTPTHALPAGSPAIDSGSPARCPEIDQRGFFRPIDGNDDGSAVCDMGSYEYGSIPPLYVFIPMVLK